MRDLKTRWCTWSWPAATARMKHNLNDWKLLKRRITDEQWLRDRASAVVQVRHKSALWSPRKIPRTTTSMSGKRQRSSTLGRRTSPLVTRTASLATGKGDDSASGTSLGQLLRECYNDSLAGCIGRVYSMKDEGAVSGCQHRAFQLASFRQVVSVVRSF